MQHKSFLVLDLSVVSVSAILMRTGRKMVKRNKTAIKIPSVRIMFSPRSSQVFASILFLQCKAMLLFGFSAFMYRFA